MSVADAGAPVRAAVDVGTNSVRLLVVDGDGRTLEREMVVTRLGQGVDLTGRLDDAALARTLDVLTRYRAAWDAHGARAVRIAATSAVRDAADRDRFFDGVRAVTGVDPEVLSGDDEARTAFAGAVGGVGVDGAVTVVDVGGGSTEVIVGDRGGVAGAISLQLGCVRLTERLRPTDPPTAADIEAARAEVSRQVATAAAHLARVGAEPAGSTLVGVAGTATTLAALHLGLDAYEPDRIHRTAVTREEVVALTRRLVGMTSADRATLGPMAPGREDVIVAGCLILDGVMERFGFGAMVASETDILDGLAAASAPA